MLKRYLYVSILMAGIFAGSSSTAEVNLRVAPLSTLLGMFDFSLDVPIAPAWTLGPEIVYWDAEYSSVDVMAYAVGLRANYYFAGEVFAQGWYLGPSVQYLSVEVEDDDPFFGKLSAETTAISGSTVVGYHWMWDSFNIKLGGGLSVYSSSDIELKDQNGVIRDNYDDSFSGAQFVAEFTLGYVF